VILREDCDQLANELSAAYRTRRPVAPLVDRFPGLTIADAYDIQQAQVERWKADGWVVKGRKVGLTSAVMQRQMGVHQPDFGVLHDGMFFLESEIIATATFLQPRVEAEVAFVLKQQIAGPGVTIAEAAAAVDFMLPALEIIDSRIHDWRIGIVDTIADNASSGGVVLGIGLTQLTGLDLRALGCNLYRNGQLAATGASGAVLGSPLASLTWLANVLGAHGEVLHSGEVILPGSFTASQPVEPGDIWTAQFAALGSVTARFAKEHDDHSIVEHS
jgi:2-keto-4-pentenoate hydratase